MPPKTKGKKDKKKGGGATPSLRDCAGCGASEGSVPGVPTHKPCSRCLMTFYCSTKCQRIHWKTGGHKQQCVAVADRRVPKQAEAAAGGAEANADYANADADASTDADASAEGGAPPPAKEKGADVVVFSGEAAEEEECAICLDPLSSNVTQMLPCKHTFHKSCVSELRSFGINQVCPMCRAVIPPGPEAKYEEAVRRWLVLHHRYDRRDFEAYIHQDLPWLPKTRNDRRELEEVLKMIVEAAEEGHSKAKFNLGGIYGSGKGVLLDYKMAVKWYRRAAEDDGDAVCQIRGIHNVAVAYREGKGVPQDDSLAAEWFRKGVDLGDAQCQSDLGTMYIRGGHGVEQDFDKARELQLLASAQGFGQAYFNMGNFYAIGDGVEVNLETSFEWYMKAAEVGYPNGETSVGKAFYSGLGVPVDYAQAMTWFMKGAEHHEPEAMYMVGDMYTDGKAVEQSDAEAVKMFGLAAEKGHASAQTRLGVFWGSGKGGLRKNYGKAMEWHLKAVAQVDEFPDAARCAMFHIGCLYYEGQGVKQSYKKALEWWKRSSDLGDRDATQNVGKLYLDGSGVPKNEQIALGYFIKGAELGSLTCQCQLGSMYQLGKGPKKNQTKACAWFRRAADGGDSEAQYHLGVHYADGKGVPKSMPAAMAWFHKAADQGQAQAQFNLGCHYAVNEDVTQDLSKAFRYLKLAEGQGIATATPLIQQVLNIRKNQQEEAQRAKDRAAASCFLRSTIPFGTRVELHGLKSQPALNGAQGTVMGFMPGTGTIIVKTDATFPGIQNPCQVKPKFIKVL